jgi:membrane protein
VGLGTALRVRKRRGASSRDAGAAPAEPLIDDPADGQPRIPTPQEAPGVDAERPSQIPAAGWKQILRRSFHETREDNVLLMSAGVAFFAFLALFPGLIAGMTLYGLVADPGQVQEQVDSLSAALPGEAARLLREQAREVTTRSNEELGIKLILSLLIALLSASGGVASLIKAVNIAYDEVETRSFVARRATALLLTVCAVVFLVVAVGVITVVPVVMNELGLDAAGRFLVQVLRWGGLVGFVLVALGVVYRYAPDRDNAKVRWIGFGSVLATALWALGSSLFSLYVSTLGQYGNTYGTLAGVVVLLLWLFLTAFIVLLGAEINSEMEHQTAKDTTQGPPQPLGQRGAVKADTVAVPGR